MPTGTKPKSAPDPAAPRGRELTVRHSRVNVGGTVRVNDNVPQTLGVDKRDRVEITHGSYAIAVHLFADSHVPPGEIVVRAPDMKRLHVSDGERVQLRTWIPGHKALRGSVARLAQRAAARLDLVERDERSGGGP